MKLTINWAQALVGAALGFIIARGYDYYNDFSGPNIIHSSSARGPQEKYLANEKLILKLDDSMSAMVRWVFDERKSEWSRTQIDYVVPFNESVQEGKEYNYRIDVFYKDGDQWKSKWKALPIHNVKLQSFVDLIRNTKNSWTITVGDSADPDLLKKVALVRFQDGKFHTVQQRSTSPKSQPITMTVSDELKCKWGDTRSPGSLWVTSQVLSSKVISGNGNNAPEQRRPVEFIEPLCSPSAELQPK